jgi:hypothetical protein
VKFEEALPRRSTSDSGDCIIDGRCLRLITERSAESVGLHR